MTLNFFSKYLHYIGDLVYKIICYSFTMFASKFVCLYVYSVAGELKISLHEGRDAEKITCNYF